MQRTGQLEVHPAKIANRHNSIISPKMGALCDNVQTHDHQAITCE